MATQSKSKTKSVSKRMPERCPRGCGTRHSLGGICFKHPKSSRSTRTSSSTITAPNSVPSCTATSSSSTTPDLTVVKSEKDDISDDIEVVSDETEADEDQMFDVESERESQSERTSGFTSSNTRRSTVDSTAATNYVAPLADIQKLPEKPQLPQIMSHLMDSFSSPYTNTAFMSFNPPYMSSQPHINPAMTSMWNSWMMSMMPFMSQTQFQTQMPLGSPSQRPDVPSSSTSAMKEWECEDDTFSVDMRRIDTVDSALNFYEAVKELVLKKGYSRNKALTRMKKDLKSFIRIEPIAQLKEISTAMYEEELPAWNKKSLGDFAARCKIIDSKHKSKLDNLKSQRHII